MRRSTSRAPATRSARPISSPTFERPDLSNIRLARYGSNFIPRNTPVIADVDDINENVGFWRPQADFRHSGAAELGLHQLPGLVSSKPSTRTWSRPSCSIRPGSPCAPIVKNPGADLVMVYIEQPDGSEHQFLLTDPRQASNPTDPTTIGANQDAAKVARYRELPALRLPAGGSGGEGRSRKTAGPNANVMRGLRPRLRAVPHRGEPASTC